MGTAVHPTRHKGTYDEFVNKTLVAAMSRREAREAPAGLRRAVLSGEPLVAASRVCRPVVAEGFAQAQPVDEAGVDAAYHLGRRADAR